MQKDVDSTRLDSLEKKYSEASNAKANLCAHTSLHTYILHRVLFMVYFSLLTFVVMYLLSKVDVHSRSLMI